MIDPKEGKHKLGFAIDYDAANAFAKDVLNGEISCVAKKEGGAK